MPLCGSLLPLALSRETMCPRVVFRAQLWLNKRALFGESLRLKKVTFHSRINWCDIEGVLKLKV